MSVYLPDNRITVPELWYPGRKPTVPVKINRNHKLGKMVKSLQIFNNGLVDLATHKMPYNVRGKLLYAPDATPYSNTPNGDERIDYEVDVTLDELTVITYVTGNIANSYPDVWSLLGEDGGQIVLEDRDNGTTPLTPAIYSVGTTITGVNSIPNNSRVKISPPSFTIVRFSDRDGVTEVLRPDLSVMASSPFSSSGWNGNKFALLGRIDEGGGVKRGFPGGIKYNAIFNGYLGRASLRSIIDNPYQFLEAA